MKQLYRCLECSNAMWLSAIYVGIVLCHDCESRKHGNSDINDNDDGDNNDAESALSFLATKKRYKKQKQCITNDNTSGNDNKPTNELSKLIHNDEESNSVGDAIHMYPSTAVDDCMHEANHDDDDDGDAVNIFYTDTDTDHDNTGCLYNDNCADPSQPITPSCTAIEDAVVTATPKYEVIDIVDSDDDGYGGTNTHTSPSTIRASMTLTPTTTTSPLTAVTAVAATMAMEHMNDIIKVADNDDEEDDENDNDDDGQNICIMCDENISAFTSEDRNNHLIKCIEEYEVKCLHVTMTQTGIKASSLSQLSARIYSQSNVLDGATDSHQHIQDDEEEVRGLRMKLFYCVVCDVDISKKNLNKRCLHLKKCARINNIPTKELLQMISPIPELEGDEDDEDEDNADGYDANDGIQHDHDNNLHQYGQASIATAGTVDTLKNNAFAFLMGNAKKVFSSLGKVPAAAAPSSKKGSYTSNSGSSSSSSSKNNKWVPPHKLIKVGSMQQPIVIDGFQFYNSILTDTYFLSHFHYDHYIGLDRSFNAGTIYCSATTAGLVRLRLKLTGVKVIPLEMEKVHYISVGGVQNISVVLIDANHCPGACMFLFSFPDSNKQVLHVGDFRWMNELLQCSSTLKKLSLATASNKKNLTVYLDTTYCDPLYAFPKQTDAITAILEYVTTEISKPGKPLFVFGAYGIGKERVYMSVAHSLQGRVHVDKNRFKSMMCYDWPMEEKVMLTIDASCSNIWVVPMNKINFNSIISLKKKMGYKYDRIIAFQPTGWSHTKSASAGGTSNGNMSNMMSFRHKDCMTICSVPYSEHSSYSELVQFIDVFQPNRVIPTVNTSKDKVQKQLDALYKVNSNGVTSARGSSSNINNRSEFY